MGYINKPPKMLDVPPFIKKRYSLFDRNFIEQLINWSKKEYFDTIMCLYSSSEIGKAKTLQSKYTYVDFMAHTNAFLGILENMNAEIWDTLSRDTRNVLIKAKGILESP
jgi:hypothetical protein